MNQISEPRQLEDLKERTLQLGLRILRLSATLPKTAEARLIRGQVMRSGTSPGAHNREACRARSDAEFISKMESATQELEETSYWLEMLERSELCTSRSLGPLRKEVAELIAIVVSCVIKTKRRRLKA